MTEVHDLEAEKRRRRGQQQSPDWLKYLITGANGSPIPQLANAEAALRLDPGLADLFAFNEMSGKPMMMDYLDPESWNGPEPVSDIHVTQVQLRLQQAGLGRIGRDTVYQAIEYRAHRHRFHPVRDWLNDLTWDGRPRLSKWLSHYLGADSSLYTDAIGRMFLISAIARIYQPGCQADYALVLAGGQGIQKSGAVSVLAGEWASDGLPDIASKDALVGIAGKWIIELPELAAIGKAEIETLKAFLTRRVDRYRPPYGRLEVQQSRQCVFIGTTNEATFLKDTTGNRRFWPVDVRSIDLEALTKDRDQLFAEAKRLYDNGTAWWPDRAFEAEHIVPEQEARRIEDPWVSIISQWTKRRDRFSMTELLAEAIKIRIADQNSAVQRRAADILRGLGFDLRKTRSVRIWERR